MNKFGLIQIRRKRTTRNFFAIGIALILLILFTLTLALPLDDKSDTRSFVFSAFPFLFLGVFLVALGIRSLHKGGVEKRVEILRVEHLKKTGAKINAEIKSIDKEIIGWGRYKEAHEYYLCVGVSENNNVMLFKSNSINFYSRLKTIGESIVVYYEPKDSENYYIEIE